MKEFIDSEAYKKIVKAIQESFHLELAEVFQKKQDAFPVSVLDLNKKGLQVFKLKFSTSKSKVSFEITVFWNSSLGEVTNFVSGIFSIQDQDKKYFEFDRYIKFVHKDDSEQKAFERFKQKNEISADEYLAVCFDLYKKYYDPFIKDVIEGRSWPQKLFPSLQDDYS